MCDTFQQKKRNEMGVTEGLTKKQVIKWLDDNLSSKVYDVKLWQFESGDYFYEIRSQCKQEQR